MAAQAEDDDNIAEQRRQHGKRVRYGEVIQVRSCRIFHVDILGEVGISEIIITYCDYSCLRNIRKSVLHPSMCMLMLYVHVRQCNVKVYAFCFGIKYLGCHIKSHYQYCLTCLHKPLKSLFL